MPEMQTLTVNGVKYDIRDANAAPSGFGYGEALYHFVGVEAKAEAYFDTLLQGMPDASVRQVAVQIEDGALRERGLFIGSLYKTQQDWAVMRLSSYGTEGLHVSKVKRVGEWHPFEYENPPMTLGVEYRTTERWQDKPVYTKLLNIGAFPSAGAVSHYTIGTGITKILRVKGASANAGFAVPYTGTDAYLTISGTVYEGSANVIVYVEKGELTADKCIAQVWYIKD